MVFHLEPMRGFEPLTSSLPRKRSTPELHRQSLVNSLISQLVISKNTNQPFSPINQLLP